MSSIRPIVSTTLHAHYLLSAIVACRLWAKWGCRPMLLVCHEGGEELLRTLDKSPVRDLIAESDCEHHYLQTVDGIKPCTIAQVSRLFAANFQSVMDNDVVITTDADMLPVSDWLVKFLGDATTFLTLGYEAYRPQRRVPMCYIAAMGMVWRRAFPPKLPIVRQCQEVVRHVTGSGENVERWRGWDVDEVYAGEIILADSTVEHLPRGFGAGGMADGRMDRANGGESWELRPGMIDAHLPRPLTEAGPWAQAERLLRGFGDDLWPWAESIRAHLMALLAGRDALV